jgi:hypothetical protein
MNYLPLIFATTTMLAVFAFAAEGRKEKAVRAITGRLIPQLPTRRRFRCITYLGGAAAPKSDGSGPSSQGSLAGTCATSVNPND